MRSATDSSSPALPRPPAPGKLTPPGSRTECMARTWATSRLRRSLRAEPADPKPVLSIGDDRGADPGPACANCWAVAPVRRAVVGVEHEVAEAAVQPPGRRQWPLLRDEERRLALCQGGDEVAMVCDLPVPGGPLMTRWAPARTASIAACWEESASRTSARARGPARDRSPAPADARPPRPTRHRRAPRRRRGRRARTLQREVGHHGQLGVGEGADDQARRDREVGHPLAHRLQGRVDGIQVERVTLRREVREDSRRPRAPAQAQVLDEDGVEPTSGPKSRSKSSWPGPVGRSTSGQSSTGAAGAQAARARTTSPCRWPGSPQRCRAPP